VSFGRIRKDGEIRAQLRDGENGTIEEQLHFHNCGMSGSRRC
jgi:hypothetical protein